MWNQVERLFAARPDMKWNCGFVFLLADKTFTGRGGFPCVQLCARVCMLPWWLPPCCWRVTTGHEPCRTRVNGAVCEVKIMQRRTTAFM